MRILLVEDERKVADMVTRGLQSEGHAVDVADCGAKGWLKIDASDYDLLVLDLGLPDIDGLELLRRTRRHHSPVPILVLTARDASATKLECFESGADDYLTKPFALAELSVRVRALLGRGSPGPDEIIALADLQIDRPNKKVTRGGHRIDLRPTEYSLLEYLVLHRDRVLSRAMIVQHVWDPSFEGLNNIVDVYMRHLREKVDHSFELKLIRNVGTSGFKVSDQSA